MKKLILMAPLALIVACSQEQPAPEATEEATTAAADMGLEVDGKPNVGTYEITQADGQVGTYVAAADGTFTYTLGDTVTKGTWSSESPGHWCDTAEGDEAPTCYTETIDENGVWTSVNNDDPSDTSTVKRVE